MFVHIGHPKTGTSSIQETFTASASVLEDYGVFHYAGYIDHHPIARRMHKASQRYHDIGVYKRFFAAAAATRCETGFFSSETLIRLQPDEIAAMVEQFRTVAEEIKVLIYVRHPVGYTVSATHQAVRLGQSLAALEKKPRLVDLKRILPRWRDAMGADNLIVRPFERAQMVNGDAVDDVLAVLGAGAAADRLTRSQRNEGLSVLGIHVLDRVNQLQGRPLGRPNILRINTLAGPRYVLPQETLDHARELAVPHLEYLEAEFGITLSEPPQTPSPPLSLSPEELDTLAALINELLPETRPPEAPERPRGVKRLMGSVLGLRG